MTIKLALGRTPSKPKGPPRATVTMSGSWSSTIPLHREHPSRRLPNLKMVGAKAIALGIVSAVLGVVAIVSISKDDSHYDRWGTGSLVDRRCGGCWRVKDDSDAFDGRAGAAPSSRRPFCIPCRAAPHPRCTFLSCGR